MKKKLLLLSTLLLIPLVSCSKTVNSIHFENEEYSIKSGEYIKIKEKVKGVTYSLVGKYDNKINLNSNGLFTFDNTIPINTQVLVVASYKNLTSNEVVVTLKHDYLDSEVTFQNKINYIRDGEYISALDSNSYGITYSLKSSVKGISINSSSGRVNFTNAVEDNVSFVVIASSSNGKFIENTFYTVTKNFVDAKRDTMIKELNSTNDISYEVDYSSYPSLINEDILDVTTSNNISLDKNVYSYDIASKTLTIKSDYLNSLDVGEHVFKIITKRNAIKINLKLATKFIKTAEDLASINDNTSSLSGYYIQVDDIDLKEYLSQNGNGYNNGLGWNPIGRYYDVLDQQEATKDAFKGTYDGNGCIIKNLKANRHDELSYNYGLFGYVTSNGVIRNLGVEGEVVCSSYSGGLVGSNSGVIENCYANVLMRVYTGNNSYRYVGGFVGNNFGTIKNCYSIGNVYCDRDFGAFCGYNAGLINSCFAKENTKCNLLIGIGNNNNSNRLFKDINEMQTFDYSNIFTSNYWKIEQGSLPKLIKNQY